MSVKHSYTTADRLPFETATSLVRKLYKDGNYRMSLLIGCGIFFGLRISDLRALTWAQILEGEEFIIYEKKTGKRRIIRVNKGFQAHARDCHDALHITDDSQPCFLNRYGSVMTMQMINRHFKTIRVKYGLKIKNFSTHSLRKTWAYEIWRRECEEGRGELAIVRLQELLRHSSENITRKYLGITQQELGEVYDALRF